MSRQVVPTIFIFSLPGIYASSIKNCTNFNSSWRLTTAASQRCRTILKLGALIEIKFSFSYSSVKVLEKRSLELDAPASRPSMYLKENRLPKKLKMPTAAGHTTIAHTPESEGLVGRAGGSGHIQSGSSGGSSAGVHGQVCSHLFSLLAS